MNQWNRRQTSWAAAAGAILLTAFLWRGCIPRAPAADPTSVVLTAKAALKPLTITVTSSGEIRPRDSNKIYPRIRRQETIAFLITEGKQVASNELVASFSPEDAVRRIGDLEDKVTQQQMTLDSAATDLAIQEMDNSTSLKTAQQNLQNAKSELEKFIQADQPLEKRNAELAVQTAQGELGRLETRLEDLKALIKEGFITEDEVEEARIRMDEARVTLETARIKLSNLEKYEHPLKQAQLENAVAKTTTELAKVQKNNETLTRNKQRALETATHQVEVAKRDLGDAREDRTALDIHSPNAGVVYYGDLDEPWRRGDIQVGGFFRQGQVIMTIPNLTAFKAVINVSEAEIRDVKTGQVATVTCDALAGRTFAGEVFKVSEVPSQQNWWSGRDVKEFSVEIGLKDASDLKPGFSCRADIVTDRLPSVLQVPVQAVFRDGETFFVYPASGRKDERQTVKVGKSSITHVQILDGLKEGASVRLSKPDTGEERP